MHHHDVLNATEAMEPPRKGSDPWIARAIQPIVDQMVQERGAALRVLEAGSGSTSFLRFGDDPYVVGIDISQAQLDRNAVLSEKIHGDIETYDLPEKAYDVIVCWSVLEHVPHPERALARFARATRPGGLIIIKVPNARSVKGLVTKLTPYRFHIWFHRRILGREWAGKEDLGPFPTPMSFSMAPDSIVAQARRLGLSVVHHAVYEHAIQRTVRAKFHIGDRFWRTFDRVIKRLTGGKVTALESEFLVVLRQG